MLSRESSATLLGAITAFIYREARFQDEHQYEAWEALWTDDGVYWVPAFEVLGRRGLAVCLVDTRRMKCVPGRKSDVLDCQWIRQLHGFGLLSAAFVPDEQTSRLRSYQRQRAMLVSYASHHAQHLHKALQQMNLKLGNVVSDITGTTGLAVMPHVVLAAPGVPKSPPVSASVESHQYQGRAAARVPRMSEERFIELPVLWGKDGMGESFDIRLRPRVNGIQARQSPLQAATQETIELPPLAPPTNPK